MLLIVFLFRFCKLLWMLSATVILFEAECFHCRLSSIKDKRDFIQAIDTLLSNCASCSDAFSCVGFCNLYYAHFKVAWLKRLMLWRKVMRTFHTKWTVYLTRFILAPQVCSLPSKRIWFILLSNQGTAEFRLVPIWSVKKHLACSQPSGTNHLQCQMQLLVALSSGWVCLIMHLLTLHRNIKRKCKKSQLISSNLWGQRLLGKIHVISSTRISPWFYIHFIQTRHSKTKAWGPSICLHQHWTWSMSLSPSHLILVGACCHLCSSSRMHKTDVSQQKNSQLTLLMDNTYVSQKHGWMRM